jgi:hypothetical protein
MNQREDSSKITIQATGATSWRRSDVKYRKNEAFVDVIETVNLMMSKDGQLPLPLLWYGRKLTVRRCAASGCGWSSHDEGVSEWNARVQVRLE